MLADVKHRIGTGLGAFAAWTGCLADIEQQWSELPDPYLRERAADVRAVGDQVRRVLAGRRRRPDRGRGRPGRPRPDPGRGGRPRHLAGHGASCSPPGARPRTPRSWPGRAASPWWSPPGATCWRCPRARRSSSTGRPGEIHVDPAPAVVDEYYRRRAADLAAAPYPRPGARPASRPSPRDGTRDRRRGQPRLGRRRPGRVRRRAPTGPGWSAPSSCSSAARRRPTSTSRRRSTPRSPRRSAGGARRCARSTSAATSRCPTCRCRRRPTRSSGVRGLRLALDRPELLHDQLVAICAGSLVAPRSA